MSYITFKNICKSYDNKTQVLKGIDLEVEEGKLLTLLGPSGCGKSTLLRCLAGLEQVQQGHILLEGRDITDLDARQRQIGMVFQQYSLFPNMTVEQNMAFGLKIQRLSKAEINDRITEALAMVGLQDKADAYPAQLSGGQQQRVALARALVVEPGVLLFDEPLSNLDAKLRVSMRTEIRRIQQEVGITAIYVTHDQSEAMALSDQIIIMNKGVVAQIGTPQEIYFHPVSEFVADFIGEANFLRGKVLALEGNTATLAIEGETAHVEATRPVSVGEEVTMVLRPESATLTEDRGLPCKVEVSCFMGSYQNYHVRVGETLVKLTEYNPKNKRIFAQGENCFVHFDANATHIL